MRGKKEPGQKAPQPPAEQRVTEGRDQGRDQTVEHDVQQVVTPRTKAMQGIVESEGEGAEWPEGFVTAAVGEQCPPEVVIQDVGPRGVW